MRAPPNPAWPSACATADLARIRIGPRLASPSKDPSGRLRPADSTRGGGHPGQHLPHACGSRARRSRVEAPDAARHGDAIDRREPARRRRLHVRLRKRRGRPRVSPGMDPWSARHGRPAGRACGRRGGMGPLRPAPAEPPGGADSVSGPAPRGVPIGPVASAPGFLEHLRRPLSDALLREVVLRRHALHRGSMDVALARNGCGLVARAGAPPSRESLPAGPYGARARRALRRRHDGRWSGGKTVRVPSGPTARDLRRAPHGGTRPLECARADGGPRHRRRLSIRAAPSRIGAVARPFVRGVGERRLEPRGACRSKDAGGQGLPDLGSVSCVHRGAVTGTSACGAARCALPGRGGVLGLGGRDGPESLGRRGTRSGR